MDDQEHPDDVDRPVCPRHPDRVSRLSCRTCGRPTCPECQRAAPAGFECVDCVGVSAGVAPAVADGSTTTRASTEDGSTAVERAAPATRPIVTYVLIALCTVVYLLQMLLPVTTDLGFFSAVAGYPEPWRFLTAAFLHSPDTVTHLLFNMMGLYVMGQFLEPFLGRARFIAVYLLSALGGAVGCLMTVPALDMSDLASRQAWAQSMVGSSGAVFGLFAAAFLVLRRTGAPVGGLVVLLALNAALPFFYPNVAWQAHLGGAIVGFVATGAVLLTSRRASAQWGALAVLAVALAVAAWVKYELNAAALAMLGEYL